MSNRSARSLKSFSQCANVDEVNRTAEHGGQGTIGFRRMFDDSDFRALIDFVDVTVIHPGSTIGRHKHIGNEEVYFIIEGKPRVNVFGVEKRLSRGDVTIVGSGQWHELINDTEGDVVIGVIQVRIPQ